MGRRVRARTRAAVTAAVLASTGLVLTACRGGGGDDRADTTTTTEPAAVAAAYEDGAPLRVVDDVAEDLEATTAAGDATCSDAVSRLDEAGTPDELAARAADVGDPVVAEAALEQQAAVSSLLAACRGDAPVTAAEAAAELAASNDALAAALDAAGVRR